MDKATMVTYQPQCKGETQGFENELLAGFTVGVKGTALKSLPMTQPELHYMHTTVDTLVLHRSKFIDNVHIACINVIIN